MSDDETNEYTPAMRVTELVQKLGEAESRLGDARKVESLARSETTRWINAVNQTKKELAAAIEPLKLEDR